MGRLILTALLATGCAATQNPACSQANLALIESSYVAEVLTSCSDYKTPEECPRYEEIKARWEEKRQEWIQCQD
jgi:hypothetical protein